MAVFDNTVIGPYHELGVEPAHPVLVGASALRTLRAYLVDLVPSAHRLRLEHPCNSQVGATG